MHELYAKINNKAIVIGAISGIEKGLANILTEHGYLVGIRSVGGLRGSRQAASYNAKAYQINYLEALRQSTNHSKLPICITDIRPGFVDTDMAKGEGQF